MENNKQSDLPLITQEKNKMSEQLFDSGNEVKDNWPLVGFSWAVIAFAFLGLYFSKYLMYPVYRGSLIFTVLNILSVVVAVVALIFCRRGLRMSGISRKQKAMSVIGIILSLFPIIFVLFNIFYFMLVFMVTD